MGTRKTKASCARGGGGGWHHSACFHFFGAAAERRSYGARSGYSPFVPTSHLPGASTSPPLFRNDAAHDGRAGVLGAALSVPEGARAGGSSGGLTGLCARVTPGWRTHPDVSAGKRATEGRYS